jgi:phosphatidylserine/phosphatidylglycerophosphate/cardiolipin synthase-like enzyme
MPLANLEQRYFPPIPPFPTSRKDVALFNRAGTLRPLIDGPAYFGAIKTALDGLQGGDACYIAGWSLASDFKFGDGAKLGDVLTGKAAVGVDVRVIVWGNPTLLSVGNVFGLEHFVATVRNNIRAAEDLRGRGVGWANRVLIDWSGGRRSSHHMKFTVIARGARLTAFVGGLDYMQNRVSAPMHIPEPPQVGKPRALGVHEVGVEVTGHGAVEALLTFQTRWEEASTLSDATYDIGAGKRPYNPPASALVDLPGLMPDPVPASTETSVQVVRSFPADKEPDRPWSTLPADGVHEVRATFQKALDAAVRYIYIEDQEFSAESLFPSLVRACHRGVKVIVLVPGYDDPIEGGAIRRKSLSPTVQRQIVDPLEDHRTNFVVYQLRGIFVHAKVILIDDEFASIGSANFMDRSMQPTLEGEDSELSVAAVTTGTMVRDLRACRCGPSTCK